MVYVYYSPQIKWLVVRHTLNGLTRDQIEEEIGIDVSSDSIKRWISLFHTTGAVISDPAFHLTPGCGTKLTEAGQRCALELLRIDPTLFLDEIARGIRERTGIVISKSALAIDLRDRLNITRKVTRTVHPNQSPELRAQFLYDMSRIPAECLIFTDESSISKRRLYRQFARAPRGERTARLPRQTASRRYSLLPAISLSGLVALKVIEGSIKRGDFESFLADQVLPMTNPFPGPNSVLVLDNASIHHNGEIRAMCSEYGVYVVHLPPYSPDYNPIEMGFGISKDHLRRSGVLIPDLTPEEEIEEIYFVAEEVFTPEMIYGLYEGSVWL